MPVRDDYETIWRCDAWCSDGEKMKFRLVFRGSLPPFDKCGVQAKDDIREQLHPQLRTLWEQHANLKRAFEPNRDGVRPIDKVAAEFTEYGMRFIPLVRDDKAASCNLDVLLLRRQTPYRVLTSSGDIDNRLKTLLDGLQKPQQQSETKLTATSDNDPFYCLLQDDCVVRELRVATDRLLLPTQFGSPPSPDEAVAVIEVEVLTREGQAQMVLGGGYW
jgi:hypothetical protein